jgi:DNA polymerase III sliding clamp (beta) subunit (PCNA family)
MNATIVAPYSIFGLAEKIVPKDQIRPALSGVALLHRKNIAVAADGFRLTTVPLVRVEGDTPFGEIIVPRAVLMDAKKLSARDSDVTFATADDGTWRVGVETKGGGVIILPFTPIDATYPDVSQFMPNGNDDISLRVSVNPTYLKHLCELAIAEGASMLTLETSASRAPIRATTPESDSILMPMMSKERNEVGVRLGWMAT